MATNREFMLYVEDQIGHIKDLRFKKMFGEYGIFIGLKMVAILSDDQLFVKPTNEGINLLENPTFAPPYPGAKPYLLIEDLDDKVMLEKLLQITYEDLPLPKEKKKKKENQ